MVWRVAPLSSLTVSSWTSSYANRRATGGFSYSCRSRLLSNIQKGHMMDQHARANILIPFYHLFSPQSFLFWDFGESTCGWKGPDMQPCKEDSGCFSGDWTRKSFSTQWPTMHPKWWCGRLLRLMRPRWLKRSRACPRFLKLNKQAHVISQIPPKCYCYASGKLRRLWTYSVIWRPACGFTVSVEALGRGEPTTWTWLCVTCLLGQMTK